VLRTLLAIALVLTTGCAYTRPKLELPAEPDPDAPRPVWRQGNHPTLTIQGGVSYGEFSYTTQGTSANRRETVQAPLYRFTARGRGSLDIEYMGRTDSMTAGTQAEAFQIFGFTDLPLWPNKRLRFQSRPGAFFQKVNLIKAQTGDVEPWLWGFRYELEGEVDLIKQPRFIVSLYASGRIGYGWGEAKVSGVGENARGWDWGWEAGVRAQLSRFFVSLGWLDRNLNVDGSYRFSSAEYRYQGAALMLGARW
jgi:hypothetical protein